MAITIHGVSGKASAPQLHQACRLALNRMGSCMKVVIVAFLVPVALVAIAAVRSGGGFAGVWSACRREPSLFCVQLLYALCGVFIIACAISVAGALVRWLLRWMKILPDEPIRFRATEGMIVGLVVVGFALGFASRDTFYSPHADSEIEFRRFSWIEAPLGFGGGSSCFALVAITFRDNAGHAATNRCSEMKVDYPGQLPERVIHWSTQGPPRAYVDLASTETYLFFPDDIDTGSEEPPEQAIEAYLRGEPVEAVNQIMRAGQGRNEPD
jgi:hypothetical protein